MSPSLLAACLWALAANLIAMTPSKDHHWRNAYILISVGGPIVLWVAWSHGLWIGLLVFAGGCSVLRWPVIYFVRWLRRILVRTGGSME